MSVDTWTSFGLLGLVLTATAAYLLRLAWLGRARASRLDKDGGSALLSVPVMELGYWLLRPIVSLLDRLGATPNGVTVFGLFPAALAGLFAVQGWFALAGLFGMVGAFCDALDGLLAQRQGGSTRGGQALDSILDRVTESLLFVGVAVYFREQPWILGLCLMALSGAYLTSYVSAKAEAMQVSIPRGVMRRAERAVYLLTAAGFLPLWALWIGPEGSFALRHLPLVTALGLIALGANLSAFVRIRALVRVLGPASAEVTPEPLRNGRPATQEFPPLSAPAPRAATADGRGVV
ncbi:MAG: CDP-alcohol phosphatidyltransferase family protein [Myxococcales bacterium]|nr:CDP-alcohol phosphatidyltransferase family protein [Myxococcales bacterium]